MAPSPLLQPDQPINSCARTHVTADLSPLRDLRLGHQDLNDRHGPEVEQAGAEGGTGIVLTNNVNAFIPLRWYPTPVFVTAVEIVLVGAPLAVESEAEVFLQGVPLVPAVAHRRRDIVTRLSA